MSASPVIAAGGSRGAGRRLAAGAAGLLLLLTAAVLLLGFANKERCTGPLFDESGRSQPAYQERAYRDACYSDIQHLWVGRDIDEHVFPYVHGGISPGGSLYGGAVEYPVLTGLLIWAGAWFAHTDAGFLLGSAVLLAPFGLAVTWWLARLSGWRALAWALAPPLVLYAFHNWDLPAVACAVAAVFAVHANTPMLAGLSRQRRGVLAAVLLGLGFAIKVYPGIFVIPLALYVLAGEPARRYGGDRAGPPGRRGLDVRGALSAVGAAAGTVVLVNLPFALAGFAGWSASFEFQQRREVDLTTNSVWFWAFRPWSDSDAFQSVMDVVSPLAVLASFVVACWSGWRRMRRRGTAFPWVAVSGAMLCGFLLLYKVHSPQYTLWLVPFFALLSVRWGWVAAYFVADAAMGIGVFRWFYGNMIGGSGGVYDGFAAQALMIGVWGRAALLAGLFVAFLRASSPIGEDENEALLEAGSARRSPGG